MARLLALRENRRSGNRARLLFWSQSPSRSVAWCVASRSVLWWRQWLGGNVQRQRRSVKWLGERKQRQRRVSSWVVARCGGRQWLGGKQRQPWVVASLRQRRWPSMAWWAAWISWWVVCWVHYIGLLGWWKWGKEEEWIFFALVSLTLYSSTLN